MKKCVFLGYIEIVNGKLKRYGDKSNSPFGLTIGRIYYYKIDKKISDFFPYLIYNLDYQNSIFPDRQIAQFSKTFFDELFMDINRERKLKLLKVSKSYDI